MKLKKLLTVTLLAVLVASCGGARDISGSKEKRAELPTIGDLAGPLANVEAKKLFGTKFSGLFCPK